MSFDIATTTRGSKFTSTWTLEPFVDPNISAIERAFQLARAGKAKDMKGLKSILKSEGYTNEAVRQYARVGQTAPINYGGRSTSAGG